MKNKLLLISVSLLLAGLVLVGCGGGGASPAATTAPSGGGTQATSAPVATNAPAATTAPSGGGTTAGKIQAEDGATIVFSGWGDQTEQKVYRDSIARFNKTYPNVKVDYQPIPDKFQDKLKASMAAGTAPDVFYVDNQLMTAFAPSGKIAPLDESMKQVGVKREDFIPQLLTIFTSNGKTYALPKDWGTLGLVYLPEAFQAAGIAEPTPDWKWDDVKKAADAISKTGKFKGFCQNAEFPRFAVWAFENGATVASDDYKTAKVDTPEMKQAAQFVADMVKSGSLVKPKDVGAGWCGEAIGKKLVGFTYEGGWMVNFMNENYKDVKWKAIELPGGPKGKADYIFTNGIGVNAASKFPKAATAFALYLTSRENFAEIAKTGFAYSPYLDQQALVPDPNSAQIAKGGSYPGSHAEYWGPNTGKVQDALGKALERIYAGDATVDEAFKQAQTEVQAALSQ